MNEAAWRRRFGQVLTAAEKADGVPAELRNVTFGAYRVLELGDNRIQDAFQRCSEADFGDAIALGAELTTGRFRAPGALPNDLKDAVAVAGGLLRGLEKALISLGSQARGKLRSRDFTVEFKGDAGWLLPFAPRHRGDLNDWPPYFARRGLARHRCIPRKLPSGHEVDLHLLDRGFGDEIVAAGGLFRSVEFMDGAGAPIELAGPFVVGGIERLDVDDLAASIAKACDPDVSADILIFPELTVSPPDRLEVIRQLRVAPWSDDLGGHRPALVVAGSWHDQLTSGVHAGSYVNASPVYGGLGEALGRHIKHAPYGIVAQGEPFRENVIPGDKILVLASRSLTVAFAICLDFCQVARANPYDDLDVDLVLVTSFGNDRTTQSHASQAQRIWDRRKTATFLVQQDDAKSYGVTGASPSERFSEVGDRAFMVRRLKQIP